MVFPTFSFQIVADIAYHSTSKKPLHPSGFFLCPLPATHSGFNPQNTAASFRVFTAK